MVHRRVSDHIARRTLQSAAFFGPLLEHWDEQDCAALDESCRKRLETARAFAAMPDVVIFAHAASQLDTKETEELHTLIRDSARRRDRVYIVIESDTHESVSYTHLPAGSFSFARPFCPAPVPLRRHFPQARLTRHSTHPRRWASGYSRKRPA